MLPSRGRPSALSRPDPIAVFSLNTFEQRRIGNLTEIRGVDVPSTASTVFYHWFLDGVFLGTNTTARRSIALVQGEQARLTLLATTVESFDPSTIAPEGYPSRRLLWWVRSLHEAVVRYRVEQQIDGGAWTRLATVHRDVHQWDYRFVTPPLADLTDYAWRVVPVDADEQTGTPFVVASERIVRGPDAPAFSPQFDAGSGRVTFTEAT